MYIKALTAKELAKLPYRFQVAFALFCAKQVVHLTDDKRAREYIKLVELWLAGEVTSEECRRRVGTLHHGVFDVYDNANGVTRAAAWAIWPIIWRPDDSDIAAESAAISALIIAEDISFWIRITNVVTNIISWIRSATIKPLRSKLDMIKEQRAYYEELLNFDENFERACL